MYSRWKILMIVGGQRRELLLNTEPLPTWPFGVLGDVGQINVLSTRNIQIERTNESRVFFEFFDRFNVVSDIQRRENNITLLYNNEPVIENARISQLRVSGDRYNVLLAGDNASLIEKLNNPLSALDWSAYEIGYSDSDITTSILEDPATTTGLQYFASVIKKTNAGIPIRTVGEDTLPSMKFATMWSEILSQNGITVRNLSATDFEELDTFKNWFIQLTTRNINTVNNLAVRRYEDGNQTVTFGTGQVDLNDTSNVFFDVVLNTIVPKYPETETTISGVINLIDMNDVQTWRLTVDEIDDQGAEVQETDIIEGTPQDIGLNRDFTVTLKQTQSGTFFRLVLQYVSVINPVNDFVEFRADIDLSSSSIYNSTYKLDLNLPDMNQIDFLKFIANKYALSVDFDNVTNTLVLYDYNTLISAYESNAEYVDITDKIVNASVIDIDTASNFAQANYVSYADNDELTEEVGRGTYLVDNKSLPNERTAFQTVFAYSDVTTFKGKPLAVLPYSDIERDEEGNATISFSSLSAPRIFAADRLQLVNDIPFEYAIATIQGLSFEDDINNYYGSFNGSNEDLKILTVDAMLTWSDVKRISDKEQKLPVLITYIDGKTEISGVFKCTKINRWNDKQPVKITLKRLKADIEFNATGLLYDDNTGAQYDDNNGALTQ